ncbi:hypothetical protein [Candidatus Symbiopectobacterium sp. NZEC135]|nr:hypothetical protein [Candidatus Symbiopectobacterium sp. NZEC135]MCW2479808.1 hypothetical protein [Candidatus Symbiopectobacterium sp. NZEC135]
MAITINQHRMSIGNYHHGKMEANERRCNKRVSNTVNNTIQKKSLTLNIKDIVPSYHVCQHRERRLQLKKIICFILLLNHVRAHTVLAGENTDISPPPQPLGQYNQTLLPLNERLPVKVAATPDYRHHADNNEKKTVERSEKQPIQ